MVPEPTSAALDTTDRRLARVRPSTTRRLNDHLVGLGKERFDALAAAVFDTAVARGAWKEIDGVARPLPVTLRPRLVRLARHGYAHHAAWQVRLALTRLGRLYFESPDVREALPLDERERAWLHRHGRPGMTERPFARLDAIACFDRPRWKESLRLIEPNVVGIGGMRYTAAAEQALLEHLVPMLAEIDPELVLERNPDPRDLLLSELLAHARALGVGQEPSIVLLDDRSLYQTGGEMGPLADYFTERGIDARYADPRELTVGQDGEVVLGGRRADVLYRYLDLGELAEMEDAGDDLSAVHRAFETGRMVPGACADLEHKSGFEIFTDSRFAPGFSGEQQRVTRDHVAWTRLLHERRTTGPDGSEIDLPEWAVRNREALVLKPNRSYGGEGVLMGEEQTEGAWAQAIDAALRATDTFVVQAAGASCVERFPVAGDDGEPTLEPRYTSVGFYTSSTGLGIFGRVGRSRVVNIVTGASVSPVLVEVR